MDTMVVLDPLGEKQPGRLHPARRPQLRRGEVIGVLCNGKPNAGPLLAAISRLLDARHGLRTALVLDKQRGAEGAGQPSPPEWVEEFAAGVRVTLVASGD